MKGSEALVWTGSEVETVWHVIAVVPAVLVAMPHKPEATRRCVARALAGDAARVLAKASALAFAAAKALLKSRLFCRTLVFNSARAVLCFFRVSATASTPS
eukprot:2452542-Alexandrium_andersonii.AAC.1